jgi:hypothetical protein
MDESTNESDWLADIQERELGAAFGLLLDALAPLGPLGAQVLYVAQPIAGVLGGSVWREAAAGLAEALEAPGGVETLREKLDSMRDEGKG